ncbi:MAG: hypothetical protein LKG27_01165 [Clostridiaceae bacterium]|jgi:hypothetical protein|nr:hypothetical protein [Clostridiaceae bacterium]
MDKVEKVQAQSGQSVPTTGGFSKDAIAKDNKKLQNIFDKFDNGNTFLDKAERDKIQSLFTQADENGNNNKKISKKELQTIADSLNKDVKEEKDKITADELKEFYTNLGEVSKQEKAQGAKDTIDTLEFENDSEGSEDETEASELNPYTVQYKERYDELIKKDLKAQGIENPTDEQIKNAKEIFKKNNPDALKTTKEGTEYLLVGTKIKLVGEVEDKNNADEQIKLWKDNHVKDTAARKKGEDIFQDMDDGIADNDKTAVKNAKEKGYRPTACQNVFYDEKSKTHFSYDPKTGKFTEMDKNITQIFADGSCIKKITDAQGKTVKETVDKNNKIQNISVHNAKGEVYVNKNFVAKQLGFEKTFNANIFFDKKTNTHYRWDSDNHKFIAEFNYAMVGRSGELFDSHGKSISHPNIKLLRSGNEMITNNDGSTTEKIYDKNGKLIQTINRDKNNNIIEQKDN